MLSNGFLQTLDLKTSSLPQFPLLANRRLQRRVTRLVLQPDNDWTLFTADDRRHDAVLTGGWVLADLRLCGLVWRTAAGRRLTALVVLRNLSPVTVRRLLVRLRWPLS